MKNIILIGLIAISICGYGQTKDRKNNISVGGGKESYNGDLGNSWFNLKEEWYGFFYLGYNRYLNKSFDIALSITYGDYGHCREEDDVPIRPDGSQVLNMYSRLTTGNLAFRYKFANGYLLKENAKLSPSIYIGSSINNLTDIWTHYRVNSGNYISINGGFGLRYNFTEKINFNYNLGIGYFTTDKIDNRSQGINDMYMQNSFALGFNF